MISRKIVKSKASSVHPSQAATQAYHWSLVGSFHQGMLFVASMVAIAPSSRSKMPPRTTAYTDSRTAMRKCLFVYFNQIFPNVTGRNLCQRRTFFVVADAASEPTLVYYRRPE